MSTQSQAAVPEGLEAALGVTLSDVRAIGGGQGRTYFASAAGEDVVVKSGVDPDLEEKIPYIAGLVEPLRDRRCLTPRILAHGPIGGRAGGPDWLGYVWMQERLPGTPATVLDDVLLADLLALITRLHGAPPGAHRNDFGAWVPGVVLEDDAGWWANAQAAGPVAASFCERLRGWVGRPALGIYPAFGPGYVHCDMNLNNILVHESRLSGLVDTEHMGVGDRGLDVARLVFEWFRLASDGTADLEAGGLTRLLEFGLKLSGPQGWRIAVGYELISRLGWRSEFGALPDTERELPLCVSFLDAIG